MTPQILIVSLLFVGLSMVVSMVLRGKFAKYAKVPLSTRLSGREIAERMLRENGIYDVSVVQGQGMLTDHYNPLTKTVSLSPDVYNGVSVSAAAVAAHECGHAVQHANAYPWLTMRSKLVPAVQFSSGIINIVLMIGVVLALAGQPILLLIGIGLLAVTVLFTLITLPVEFDASRRAMAWLSHTSVTNTSEYPLAKDALHWAAMTYVVAALAAVVNLIQYIMLYLGSRDRR